MLYLIKETDINMHTAKDNPMPKHSIDKRIITYTRKARKLEKRIVKTTSHITFLDTCLEQNLIPKGFTLKWSPSFQETNGEGEKIQNILRHSSTRLIEETSKHNRDLLESLEGMKQNLLDEIHKAEDIEEEAITRLHQEVRKTAKKTKTKIEQTKAGKLNALKNKTSRTARAHTKEEDILQTIRVKGDGNCLFRAVSQAVHNNQDHHAELRKQTVSHISQHRDRYGAYVDTEMDKHLDNMSHTDGRIESYGTDAEVLALAEILQTPIHVYSKAGKENVCQRFGEEATQDGTRCPIRLLNQNDHYEPIAKKDVPVPKTKRTSKQESRNIKDGVKDKSSFETVVFNLSNKELTAAQKTLLEKGLKFIPTRKKVNMATILADLREWERKMRLAEYFHDSKEDQDQTADPGTVDKIHRNIEATERNKIWMPPPGRDPSLDLYIEMVKEDIINGMKRTGDNLTNQERQAFRELMKDDSIVIRPADKGSGIVILDKDKYVNKVNDDLANNATYKKLPKDTLQTVTNKVKKLARDLHRNGCIDDQTRKYMLPNNPRHGKVKANPKMHKQDNPIRTIVSSINHPTEKLAEVAESELKEWVESLETYIKDTTHFLHILNNDLKTLPREAILFTMDVKALYPSVPRKEGLEACRKALDHRTKKDIPTEAVIDMIQLVLDNNTFQFHDQHYVQTEGTAIGSKLGRNYACTYMGEWEQELMTRTPHKPYMFKRYVDDIFGVWTEGEHKLLEFQKLANSIHNNIKVTMTASQNQVPFLDVLITSKEGDIQTTIYEKETDRHMYVQRHSEHPKLTKDAIPYGLGIRAKRICSTKQAYMEGKQRILKHMQNRGYKRDGVEKTLERVDNLDRPSLLQYKRKRKELERVPLILTYGQYLPHIPAVLRQRQNILERSERLKKVFTQPPMAAYRRDANLQDILVHGKHRKMFDKTGKPGTQKCGKSCAICKHMHETNSNKVKEAKNMVFLDRIDCKTRNVIYGILCEQCNKVVYVGETGTMLYQRFANHISSIRRGKDEPIANHFNGQGHKLNNLKILGIEILKQNNIHQRKIRESFWIEKLNTISPEGLNQNKGVGDQDRGIQM